MKKKNRGKGGAPPNKKCRGKKRTNETWPEGPRRRQSISICVKEGARKHDSKYPPKNPKRTVPKFCHTVPIRKSLAGTNTTTWSRGSEIGSEKVGKKKKRGFRTRWLGQKRDILLPNKHKPETKKKTTTWSEGTKSIKNQGKTHVDLTNKGDYRRHLPEKRINNPIKENGRKSTTGPCVGPGSTKKWGYLTKAPKIGE